MDCGQSFPWIEPALRHFAEPMMASARRSDQTTEEALEVSVGGVKDRWRQYSPPIVLKMRAQCECIRAEWQ